MGTNVQVARRCVSGNLLIEMIDFVVKLELLREVESGASIAALFDGCFSFGSNLKSSRRESSFRHCPQQASQLVTLRGLFVFGD